MKRLFEMVGGLLGPKKTHIYYMEQGAAAIESADYQTAEREYLRALELAEEARKHDDIAKISLQLGYICEHQDRLAVAETHYRKAYQTEEDSEHYEEAANALVVLGKLYHKMRRMPDAEQVLQYAMSIFQQHLNPQHRGVADAAVTLADCYLDRKSYAEAEKLLLRAIAIDTAEKGADDPAVAVCVHKLALALAGQSKEKEAERSFQQAVGAFDKMKSSMNKETAHKACACYHDFGRFYLQRQRQGDAKPFLSRGLALAEEFPGYLDEADLADKCSAAAGT